MARPHAFNFHFDQPASPNGQGQFRGLAFANFFEPDQATAALTALNGYDIHGRKLRVEYKRQLRAGEKEKIEMAKALKRIRSASQLRGERSPEDYPALHQMPPPPSQHYGYGVQPPFSQQMGYNLMPDRYSPSVPNHALASPNVLSSSSASDADVSSSQYYSTTDTGNSTSTSPTLQQKPITQRRQASAVKTGLFVLGECMTKALMLQWQNWI